MKSKVYFIPVDNSDGHPAIKAKFSRLLNQSKLFDFLSQGEKTAIKMHFGEEGNTGYVLPEYIRVAVEDIIKKKAHPFLSDTNTLYQGRRTNSSDHLKLAHEHGFIPEKVGCKILIPDDTKPENVVEIKINQEFIKVARVAKIFIEADAIVDIAHFKGHIMSGFGGVLKNIGMGCAVRKGKLAQHSDVSPIVYEGKCVGCGVCVTVCPAKAIIVQNDKARILSAKCIGCASCIASCPHIAIDVSWEAGGSNMQEKMIEYAFAVLKGKENKSAFINFAVKITKECDCLAKDDPRISPDIGIFASTDPVSVDKATVDAVNKKCGRDIFQEAHPHRDYNRQLRYAHKLGLGSLDYELIELS